MNANLGRFLDRVSLGDTRQMGPLTLVPLVLQGVDKPLEVALLDEESALVREVGETGVVGRLRVESLTQLPLLLVAGELVRGAKQDRLINASVLIAPGGELDEVPVSCIEQGRWAYRGRRRLSSADTAAPWRLRSSAMLRASRSRRRTGRHDADQGSVWQEVETHLRQRRVRSGTANLLDAMEAGGGRPVASLGDLDAWEPGMGEVGAVLFVDGSLCGLEAFCSPHAWGEAGRRILRGLCADAATRAEAPADAPALARALLERIRRMTIAETEGVGLGTELHGEAERTHLTALTVAPGQLSDGCVGGLVHLRVARLETDTRRHPEPLGDGPQGDEPAEFVERRQAGLTSSVMNGFEAREQQRMERRVELGHLASRDELHGRVVVGGLCLVMPMPTYERALRSHLSDGLVPPIPHRCGGGLVLWRSRARRPLTLIAGAFEALGVPARLYAYFDPRPTSPDLPDWLEVTPRRDGSAMLHLVDH